MTTAPFILISSYNMIIYNVTVKVQHLIATEWLEWLKSEHIPDIISTGCFTHATILHLYESDDEEGLTYAVQYHSAGREFYENYISRFADTMRKRAIDKWGEKFIAYRTVMEVVN